MIRESHADAIPAHQLTGNSRQYFSRRLHSAPFIISIFIAE
jgi:hypothetical protein